MSHPLRGPGRTSTVRTLAADGTPRPARIVGVLPDGTAHFAPLGTVLRDGPRLCCHLCGRWFRSVTVHLRSHGWTLEAYRETFGLEVTAVLEGAETRSRRGTALTTRLARDPALREAVDHGRQLARTGDLSRHAAKASRGRRHSPQRREKSLAALSAVSPDAQAAANRRRARAGLEATAARVAARHGFPDLGAWVLDRLGAGVSLAQASREAGLDKDWLQRHLPELAPEAAARAAQVRLSPAQARLRDAAAARGSSVPDLLRRRHLEEGATVRALALELGVARSVVERVMVRHGIRRRTTARGSARP